MKLDSTLAPPTATKKRGEDPEDRRLNDQMEEGETERQRMDWVGSLLQDARRLNFESRVRRVGRGSGMILLPGAWVGRRVKISVELLD
jgi:putative transposon-encoded protein